MIDLSKKRVDELVELHIAATRNDESFAVILEIETELAERGTRGQKTRKFRNALDIERAGGDDWLLTVVEGFKLLPDELN